MAAASAPAASTRAGFTLVELMITLAVMCVLGVIAIPSLGAMVSRQRLQSVAHALQADVAQAKIASARQGQTVFIRFQPGNAWCYQLSTAPGGDCQQADTGPAQGVLRTVRAADHPGIALVEAETMVVDAIRPDALPGSRPVGRALFAARDGLQLQVRVGPQSRAWLCSQGLPIPGTPPCPVDAPAS